MSSLCASPEQACMLLGGKQDDSIGTYLFKPIQRVCKYPLLFRVSALHAQPLLSTGCTTFSSLCLLGAREVHSAGPPRPCLYY